MWGRSSVGPCNDLGLISHASGGCHVAFILFDLYQRNSLMHPVDLQGGTIVFVDAACTRFRYDLYGQYSFVLRKLLDQINNANVDLEQLERFYTGSSARWWKDRAAAIHLNIRQLIRSYLSNCSDVHNLFCLVDVVPDSPYGDDYQSENLSTHELLNRHCYRKAIERAIETGQW